MEYCKYPLFFHVFTRFLIILINHPLPNHNTQGKLLHIWYAITVCFLLSVPTSIAFIIRVICNKLVSGDLKFHFWIGTTLR